MPKPLNDAPAGLLIKIGQLFTLENNVQSLLFADLFAGHGDHISGGIVMMTAMEVFGFRCPVQGIGRVGTGKAQGLEIQYFQPALVKFLATGGGDLFQARTLIHAGNGLGVGNGWIPAKVKRGAISFLEAG
jgi:hypothetical protein